MPDNPSRPNTPDPTTVSVRPVIAIVDLVRRTTYVASPDDRGERMTIACGRWAKEVAAAARAADPERAVSAAWHLVGALSGAYIVVAETPTANDRSGPGPASA